MNRYRNLRARGVRSLRAGFTLVELLVVIVIIGLLATAVVTNYDKIFPKARLARVQADLKHIEGAIDIFKMNNTGRAPDTLEQLVTPDENGESYLKNYSSVPQDPWGNDYFYNTSPNGISYALGSFGADGQPSGQGEDEDITLSSMNQKAKK